MSSDNEAEYRRRCAEIRRHLGLIRDKLEAVYSRIGHIEVQRIRNWRSGNPSAEFELQCQAELEECREQEQELKERFSIQADMLTD